MVERDPLTAFSRQAANEFVRKEIATLLQSRDIHSLGSYGWSGPDDYDNEMIGHAMWQTNSLHFRFLDAHFSATYANGSTPPVLEPWQQFLVASGGDFEGLLEASRLSVGLTLFQQGATERDHYDESSLFQVHLMSSMVLLGAASDRLRDVFIAGVFRVDTDQYERARSDDKKAKWYNAPFIEAAKSPAAVVSPNAESFATLPVLANRMWQFRKARNDVVHVAATELGRQQRDLAKKEKADRVDENYWYEEMQAYQKQFEEDYRKRVNGDVDRLVEWYKLLIEMSNHVFIVENRLRHQR